METKKKSSIFSDIPSWALALLTLIGAFIVLFGLGEGVGNILNIDENIAGAIPYIIFDVLIAVACYFIVKQNPRSIWYVPLICNVTGIIAAVVEPTFWVTSLWILICGGWLLSLAASFLGMWVGRRGITNG
ncbi:MAG: hypothetical protein D4R67_12305 [Bacteroidetes bacterium]|nr:MAG: hypothetical protein D4R67_12305 [Bacteroidota bacterium]